MNKMVQPNVRTKRRAAGSLYDAAPNLLAELKRALAILEVARPQLTGSLFTLPTLGRIERRFRTVIHQAEGRS